MTAALVVDDDAVIRSVIRKALEGEGYEVLEAEDGLDGLRVLRERPADLVLTDIVMPGMDGFQFMEELRKVSSAVQIIAMSGGGPFPAGTLLGPASALGADAVLMKPFSIDELRAELVHVQQRMELET